MQPVKHLTNFKFIFLWESAGNACECGRYTVGILLSCNEQQSFRSLGMEALGQTCAYACMPCMLSQSLPISREYSHQHTFSNLTQTIQIIGSG